jgi:hypothetical protein
MLVMNEPLKNCDAILESIEEEAEQNARCPAWSHRSSSESGETRRATFRYVLASFKLTDQGGPEARFTKPCRQSYFDRII